MYASGSTQTSKAGDWDKSNLQNEVGGGGGEVTTYLRISNAFCLLPDIYV